MGMKPRNPLEWYRASPEIRPSAQADARILAAARASRALERPHREWLVAGAAAAAVAAAFYLRIETTAPPEHLTASGFGHEEGLTRDWLMDFDLQQPTGPGSQEGLP